MPEITEKIRGVPAGTRVYAFRRVDPRRLHDDLAPFVLVGLSSVVGRDPRQAECFVDDPSVSRRHFVARYTPRRKGFEVVDLESSNGLFVNGVRVREQKIAPNDVIRAGAQLLVFTQVAEASLRHVVTRRDGAFAGVSDPLRAVNDGLAALPAGGRLLLSGEPGVGKAEAVRHVVARRGVVTRLLVVHGTALREAAWESSLLAKISALTGASEIVLHLDDLSLAPAAAQERLDYLARSNAIGARAPVTMVATLSAKGRTAAETGLTPGLLARLGPPFLYVPPLRLRREDILPTFVAALRRRGRCSPVSATAEFVEGLLLHPWPGHAAEVGALVDLLAAAGRLEATFDVPDLQGRLMPVGPDAVSTDARSVVEALREARGNVSEAARRLGVSRRHFYRLVERHGLDPANWRPASRSVVDPT